MSLNTHRQVEAILCSDLHFSQNPPSARSAETDWFAAQRRPICEVIRLQETYGAPVIVAGDFFHKWCAPYTTPELINFLMDVLPRQSGFEWYAIPGQHDLPDHRIDAVWRSPFGTLLRSGHIRELPFGSPVRITANLRAHGFPWGCSIQPRVGDDKYPIELAVVHEYVWQGSCKYIGAKREQHIEFRLSELYGFDCAVFGDNHKGFLVDDRFLNCGAFIRRNQDEREYRPMVGLLYSDGRIGVHYLDVSEDVWLDSAVGPEIEKTPFDGRGFVESLRQLGPDSLDFSTAIDRRMVAQQTSQDVRDIVRQCVG